ncbi:MAG: hypothetical protein NXI31_22080 [bacterium]|nr:hypothetical protein [bacterium]
MADTGFDHVANEKRFHRTLLIGFGSYAALFLLAFGIVVAIRPTRVSMVVVDVTVVADRDAASELVNEGYEPEIRGAMVRLRFDSDIELERYGKGTAAHLHFALIPVGQERTVHSLWTGPIRRVRGAKERRYEVYVPIDTTS